MGATASQITSLTIVYSTVYADANGRKHQGSASLTFVWGIHGDRWIPRTNGQYRGKCFHLMTSSWFSKHISWGTQYQHMSSSCIYISYLIQSGSLNRLFVELYKLWQRFGHFYEANLTKIAKCPVAFGNICWSSHHHSKVYFYARLANHTPLNLVANAQ